MYLSTCSRTNSRHAITKYRARCTMSNKSEKYVSEYFCMFISRNLVGSLKVVARISSLNRIATICYKYSDTFEPVYSGQSGTGWVTYSENWWLYKNMKRSYYFEGYLCFFGSDGYHETSCTHILSVYHTFLRVRIFTRKYHITLPLHRIYNHN